MHPVARIFGIIGIFFVVTMSWLILGGVTSHRTSTQAGETQSKIAELWGNPQTQKAPQLDFHWTTERTVTKTETVNGKEKYVTETIVDEHKKAVSFASSELDVNLRLDQ